jgi:enediyne biosynthesis protein E4
MPGTRDRRRNLRGQVATVLFGLEQQPVGLPAERPEVGRNTLFWNRGDGTYAEIAQLSGLHASEWSWSPVFLDVDLDGYEDCLIPTGHGFDTQDADAEDRIRAKGPWPRARFPLKLFEYPRLDLPNLAFRNRGDLTFEEVSQAWGFDLHGLSQGIALADLDNDGDLDVVINNMNQAAALLRNETAAPRVAVRLRGLPPNTRGIGARISVRGGPVDQSQQIVVGGRFSSSDDPMRVFAAGSTDAHLTIEVAWRSGRRTLIENARPNRLYEIEEAPDPPDPLDPPDPPDPFFADVSASLGHTHHEELFDDWARQPTLPQRLSQLGPGLAWFDVNGDGREDLMIGSGRGGAPVVLLAQAEGGFRRLQSGALNASVARDQTTLLGWHDPDGQPILLAGSSNYEDARPEGAMVREYLLRDGRVRERFPGAHFSVGPLALADCNGDGQLELFVGGRVVPARYPEPPASLLFRNEAGKWVLDEENSRRLAGVGMVSDAVWTDLTGDGLPELVLACEWGPLRVFRNRAGQLEETTADWRLEGYTGWWNGVAAGDFDGDGRMDLIASNVGANTRYEPFRANPIRLYYGDFNRTGGVDLFEAYSHPRMPEEVPWRSLASVAQSMPFVRGAFPTHDAYARASIREILGPRVDTARVWSAQWLETTVFLNRGNRFEARPLPREAQVSPAFGIGVGDFDGDGHEDLVLAQNFFAVHPEDSPYASGRGLWLRGDGTGNFHPVAAGESGIEVYGEQRGCAVADFDQDGRLDFALAQNGGPTRLFRNVGGRPGLRVRLQGPPGNPRGIGAAMRLVENGRFGPAREVRAGGGYWSQAGAVQVLGSLTPPTHLWVRWPGGRTQLIDLPESAREIVVSFHR